MPKTIVFCADGTWNSPGNDQDSDELPDPTNVYKLFLSLTGELASESLRNADEQEKSHTLGGELRQVAKYIHGVGDSRNPIIKLMGGTFGAGVVSRIVRGYTFISRNFEPGDDIVIVGFSRGAYTARALGGLIASQGLLDHSITADKELAYRRGGEAWARCRRAATTGRRGAMAALREVVSNLPGFLSQKNLRDEDLHPVERIAAMAVWDTVGAMGVPQYAANGERVDAYQFADLKLSTKVAAGFHAVALDEMRGDFTPTLWEPDTHVTQMLFPGAHCDVGGGYPTRDNESGLADGALKWMSDQLAGVGVKFSAAGLRALAPDSHGVAHRPWAHGPWRLLSPRPRSFSAAMALAEHGSVVERCAAQHVLHEPGERPARYTPLNRPAR